MPSKPKPTMDPAEARKLLTERRDEMLSFTGDDEYEHWRTGRAYAQVVDQLLAEAAGYKKPQDFVAAELKGTIAASSLRRYAAVARVFPEAVAARFGMTKLSTLLTIHHLAPFDPLPPDPSELPIKLDADGQAVTKPFTDCSKAELSQCVKLLKGTADAGLTAEDKAELDRLQKIVDATLGEESEAQVRVRRKGDEVTFDYLGIPQERRSEVLKALAG